MKDEDGITLKFIRFMLEGIFRYLFPKDNFLFLEEIKRIVRDIWAKNNGEIVGRKCNLVSVGKDLAVCDRYCDIERFLSKHNLDSTNIIINKWEDLPHA